MSKIDHNEIYEEDLLPLIEDLDRDPFRSNDLSEISGYSAQVIGRTLSSASRKEQYEIEIIDRFPYVFTTEGNTEYIEENSAEEELDEPNNSPELDEVYELLEEEEELEEEEVRSKINEVITMDSLGAKMERNGQIFQEFKDYRDVEYDRENNRFQLSDES